MTHLNALRLAALHPTPHPVSIIYLYIYFPGLGES